MRLFLSILALFVVSGSCHAHAKSPTARLDSGLIIGTTTTIPSATAIVNKFLGVPFADSPPKRFTPPKPAKRWHGALKTQEWRDACVQQFNYPEAARNFTELVFNNINVSESEDCLYLNVYAPSTPAPPGGRAVLFWIYGGSLQFGTANQAYYDGSLFAAYEDVIVVTTNYRTNVFGFPSSPQIPPTERNLGFLDQRFALQWVQRNIRQFGGDPRKVTIFGESAGGVSVDALLTSYDRNSKAPFRAGILESGSISFRARAQPATALANWNNLTSQLGCSGPRNLSCVANKPATELKSIIEHGSLIFPPLPDNYTYYSNANQRRLNGEIAYAPTMSGTNAQEGRVFEFGQNDTDAWLQTTYPTLTEAQREAIKAAYPLGVDGIETDYDQLSQIYTEANFQCVEGLFANATAATDVPSWRYYFNATFPNLHPPGLEILGIYHSSEIPLVFRSHKLFPAELQPATAQEDALGQLMQAAWARFAKNPVGGPGWAELGSGANYSNGQGGRGADDEDLGIWQPTGLEVGRRGPVDRRCELFTSIYQASGALPPS